MQRSRKINPYREKKNQPKLTQIDTNDRISKDIKRHNVTALGEFKIETKIFFLKKAQIGNFLVVQWLGLYTSNAGAQVQSLVRKIRSCKAHSVATINK